MKRVEEVDCRLDQGGFDHMLRDVHSIEYEKERINDRTICIPDRNPIRREMKADW